MLEATVYNTKARVFLDKNRNGMLDAREPLLQNVSVLFDSNENGIQDSDERTRLTDSSGRFAALLPYGTTKLKLNIPGRYRRLGLFSRNFTIRLLNGKSAAHLMIGLTPQKR